MLKHHQEILDLSDDTLEWFQRMLADAYKGAFRRSVFIERNKTLSFEAQTVMQTMLEAQQKQGSEYGKFIEQNRHLAGSTLDSDRLNSVTSPTEIAVFRAALKSQYEKPQTPPPSEPALPAPAGMAEPIPSAVPAESPDPGP